MNVSLLEELLLESEGTSLDFKSKQYKFASASNDEKSELLKDILAFANSFRRTDAYILIGAREVAGRAAQIVGTESHLEDANLQQFVNSKTNRDIEFSYEAVPTSSGSVGVIRIALQDRPFYLMKDFGRLKKAAVYYRLGSSTAEATPDVVARMGAIDSVDKHQAAPVLHLELANLEDRRAIGTTLKAAVIAYEQHEPEALPDYKIDSGWYDVMLHRPNRHFWREFADFIRIRAVAVPLGMLVENHSQTIAKNVLVTISLPLSRGVEVFDELPDEPESSWLNSVPGVIGHRDDSVSVEQYGDTWSIVFHIGSIQPNTRGWAKGPVYLGPFAVDHLVVDATISADNLPQPYNVQLEMDFDVEHREQLTLEKLEYIHSDHVMKKLKNKGEG